MSLDDYNELKLIRQSSIKSYIKSKGWNLYSEDNVEWVFYNKNIPFSQIIIPKKSANEDYVYRINDALKCISRAENTNMITIYNNLINYSYDVIRFPIEDRFSIPISICSDVIENIKKIFLYSAWSILDNKVIYDNNIDKRVGELLNKVDLGYVEKGSYIFTVFIPLECEDIQSNCFTRKISKKMIDSFKNVKLSIDNYFSSNDKNIKIELFEKNQISVNLCQAFINLNDILKLKRFIIKASLSPEISEKNYNQEIIIENKYIPYIRSSIDSYYAEEEKQKDKERFEQIEEYVYVYELLRKEDQGSGTITVLYLTPSGDERQLKVQLEESMYKIALVAHSLKRKVKIKGTIEHKITLDLMRELVEFNIV